MTINWVFNNTPKLTTTLLLYPLIHISGIKLPNYEN